MSSLPVPPDRRHAIKQIGVTVLGFFGLRSLLKARDPAEGVFATSLLRDTPRIHFQEGYYDQRTQLYHDRKTGRPMFAAEKEAAEKAEPKKRLSDQELADLLDRGRFIDSRPLEKFYASGLRNTWSRVVTLSTSQCCPIITDTERDTTADDNGTEEADPHKI
ncbi:MAG: hypothetical protein HYX71_05630 [Opitutae bacterium]|nr:hypothetical protein [Opitutae bacterium]